MMPTFLHFTSTITITSQTTMSTESSSSNNGKLIAILSYFGILWIVAVILHFAGGNKTKLGAFHLSQTLGLFIVGIIAGIICGILIGVLGKIGWIVYTIVAICLFVLWVLGLIAAIKGEEKPMPVIGAKIQSILGGLFN